MGCMACFRKQQRINELEWKLEQSEAKVRSLERTTKEGLFGSATPSSKLPVKANSLEDRQALRGGARAGHTGHGRKAVRPEQAGRVEAVRVEARTCPRCGAGLQSEGPRKRTVTDLRPVETAKVLYRLERKVCPKCGRRVEAKPPGTLPRSLYSNAFLSYVAEQHYLWGTPLGRIEQQTGVGIGALIAGQKRLAELLAPAVERLAAQYRRSPVKHADETGWRTDGRNGYAWLFATGAISLFRFRQSRSAAVAAEVFGPRRLPGVLVVDRYNAYNRAPVALQYCLAHLKRDVDDLARQFPEQSEVAAFVESLSPLLAEAMGLRGLKLPRKEFDRRAAHLKRRIVAIVRRPSQHPAIQRMQDIFHLHRKRLYHWARDPAIPAENNLAERDLRPLVIARKVSFGSQSEAGALTRETLMTLLHTLKKRTSASGVAPALNAALDHIAQNPSADPWVALFGPNPRNPALTDQE